MKKNITAAPAKLNKSQMIRDYKAAHADLGPTAIADALTAQGCPVSTQMVSTVLSKAANAEPKAKTVKKAKATKPASPVAVPVALAYNNQKVDDVLGLVDVARQFLSVCKDQGVDPNYILQRAGNL